MLKKFYVRMLLVLVLAAIFGSLTASPAQSRLRFKTQNGKYSAKTSGVIKARASRQYIFRVRENKEIIVNLNSATGKIVALLGGKSEKAEIEPIGEGHWRALVGGDYIITLENQGKATRYTMLATIK